MNYVIILKRWVEEHLMFFVAFYELDGGCWNDYAFYLYIHLHFVFCMINNFLPCLYRHFLLIYATDYKSLFTDHGIITIKIKFQIFVKTS